MLSGFQLNYTFPSSVESNNTVRNLEEECVVGNLAYIKTRRSGFSDLRILLSDISRIVILLGWRRDPMSFNKYGRIFLNLR